MITIYHHPRCAVSRKVLKLIEESGKKHTVIEYLKNVPSLDELKKLLLKLNLNPTDVIRKNEMLYKKNFKEKNFSREEWLKIIIENPVLLERPIVELKYKAFICRPPEKCIEFLKKM